MTARRRPVRYREAGASCVCGAEAQVRIPLAVYARRVAGRPEAAVLWSSRCVCGEGELVLTVGDARRAPAA